MYLNDEDKSSLDNLLKKLTKKKENYERIKLIAKKLYSCFYCLGIIKNIEVFLNCQHYYCEECFNKLIQENNSLCLVCKFKFRDSSTDLFTIGRLTIENDFDKVIETKINQKISIEKKDLIPLKKKNFEEFNEDIMNLFKLQINK